MGKVVTNKNDTSAKKRFAKAPKLEPKRVTKGSFNGIEYDSLDELGILQWLFELKAYGYIKSIKRAESFLLCDRLNNNYAEQMKRVSSKPMCQTLLHGHSYTPEFRIVWDKKALDKIVWMITEEKKFDKFFIGKIEDGDIVTYIEVKPGFDQNNMERLFKLNQKWMWDKHEIFVNLVKIKDLFPISYTPKAYLTTPSGKTRVLKWKARTLNQFLNDK